MVVNIVERVLSSSYALSYRLAHESEDHVTSPVLTRETGVSIVSSSLASNIICENSPVASNGYVIINGSYESIVHTTPENVSDHVNNAKSIVVRSSVTTTSYASLLLHTRCLTSRVYETVRALSWFAVDHVLVILMVGSTIRIAGANTVVDGVSHDSSLQVNTARFWKLSFSLLERTSSTRTVYLIVTDSVSRLFVSVLVIDQKSNVSTVHEIVVAFPIVGEFTLIPLSALIHSNLKYVSHDGMRSVITELFNVLFSGTIIFTAYVTSSPIATSVQAVHTSLVVSIVFWISHGVDLNVTVAVSSPVYHLTPTDGHDVRVMSPVFVIIAGVATLEFSVAKNVTSLLSHTGNLVYSAVSTHATSQVVVGWYPLNTILDESTVICIA